MIVAVLYIAAHAFEFFLICTTGNEKMVHVHAIHLMRSMLLLTSTHFLLIAVCNATDDVGGHKDRAVLWPGAKDMRGMRAVEKTLMRVAYLM